MPEARHSMLLSDVSDARQTSPLRANAPLPHRSVCPPDLDLRQVPRASERGGHEIESSSNLGSGWHPWRRTGALGRISWSRLEAPATADGTASMKDLAWRCIGERGVRTEVVVPALETRQGSAEGNVVERDHFVGKGFFLEGSYKALLDGDAAMPADSTETGPNVVVVAPIEVLLAEFATLVANSVLRRASGALGCLVKNKAYLVGGGSPLESSKAEGVA